MAIVWPQHPILTPPTDEELAVMEPQEVVDLHKTYVEAIGNAEKDPYRYGWVLDHWKIAESLFSKYRTLLLFGSNRSGKTFFGARSVVRAALENDGALIFCFSQSDETSILVQQPAIYHYLPAELKKKATESDHYISYSIQNGFSNKSLVLPNKSRIVFKTYTQFQQNQTILEGMELGSRGPKIANLGAWLDEYLLGMELLDRLYLRLATLDAKLLLTFTPKDGITETVRYFLDGADTKEQRVAELMEQVHGKPGYVVPYVQHNAKKNTGIVYFHSKDNPWSGYATIVEQCKAKNDPNYTLTAAYGVPTKSYTSKFPNFSVDVNVVKHEQMPKDGLTKYMVLDPAGRKNWAMLWVGIDASDTWWVYREWPDVNVGDWAEWRSGQWRPGEGAKGLGYGINDYVELISQLESQTKDVIIERLIDPRMGAAKYMTHNGASSIIEELADAGLVFIPAPGLEIDDGLQALQTKMAYDRKRPIDALNRPHFYVSDRCQNLILCLQEYTAEGGNEEATKDFCDLVRYLAISGATHYNPTAKKRKPVVAGY